MSAADRCQVCDRPIATAAQWREIARTAKALERAAIVEWLLDRADSLPRGQVSGVLYEAVDAISAGKHEQEES